MITQFTSKLRSMLLSDRFTVIHGIIQLLTMFGWLMILSYSSAFYVVYLLMGLFGFWCRNHYNRNKRAVFSKAERSNLMISCGFSLVLILANYDIASNALSSLIHSTVATHSDVLVNMLVSHFTRSSVLLFLVFFPFLFLGGTYHTFFILRFITEKAVRFMWPSHHYSLSSRKVFLLIFLAMSSFYSAIMLLGFYPGIVSIDSVNQITQIVTGRYTNWHPFYHTNLIRFFVFIGTRLLHDINFGVALYSLFSILYVSAAFSYAAVTLYHLKIHIKIIIAVTLFCALMPYNILYSFTMWKDVPFSASILLFTVSLFRYFHNNLPARAINAAILVCSAFGICLFRGNGLIVLFILLIVSAVLFGKTQPRICLSLACVLSVSLIMTYPVLNALHIEQADTAELISMPLQQISRTLADSDDISAEQLDLISKVVDPDALRYSYAPYISDPLKNLVRNGNQNYLNRHKREYAGLYVQLGLSHPGSYLAAWIDQTKGYWNAGYDYWRFGFSCYPNDAGVRRTAAVGFIEKSMYGYAELFEYVDLLRPFVSIGLHTWLILLAAFIGYRKKDKLTVFLTVPCLAIVFTHLIGSPVFSEFRYAYALFCCLPFLAVITFRRSDDEKTKPCRQPLTGEKQE